MKTLIVEDDFTSRLLLQKVLSQHGECHIAVNGKEAVEAFLEARDGGSPYDLVCMDIQMPEMDGHAAVEEIRRLEEVRGGRRASGVKIIMTTSVNDLEEVIALKGLADAYLLKPIDVPRLEARLEAMSLVWSGPQY